MENALASACARERRDWVTLLLVRTLVKGLACALALVFLSTPAEAQTKKKKAKPKTTTTTPSETTPTETNPTPATPAKKKARKKKKKKEPTPPPVEATSPPVETPPSTPPPPATPPLQETVIVPLAPAEETTAQGPAEETTAQGKGAKDGEHPGGPPEADITRDRGVWLGARYTLNAIPPFMSGLAFKGADTLFFHTVGLELELERGRLSTLFALSYSNLSTGGFLVRDPSAQDTPLVSDVGSVALIESKMQAVSLSADFLYALAKSNSVSLEIGAGIGAGYMFGTLTNNWVREDPKGEYELDGRNYSACRTVLDGAGCRTQDHAEPLPAKVYTAGLPHRENSWLSGGKRPVILPYLALPELALRLKLSEAFAVRITAGASVTGAFLRIGGNFRIGE